MSQIKISNVGFGLHTHVTAQRTGLAVPIAQIFIRIRIYCIVHILLALLQRGPLLHMSTMSSSVWSGIQMYYIYLVYVRALPCDASLGGYSAMHTAQPHSGPCAANSIFSSMRSVDRVFTILRPCIKPQTETFVSK